MRIPGYVFSVQKSRTTAPLLTKEELGGGSRRSIYPPESPLAKGGR